MNINMNINRKALRVLCYGDSNTWGYVPSTGRRHPVGVRWTSLLQKKLGNNYEVIEEGLNGRTTVLDDPQNAGKNGKAYLIPCLLSTDPIDLVILMLGTNDLKERFHRSPEQISNGVEALLKTIKDVEYYEGAVPKIILMAPPIVDESVKSTAEKYLGAEAKSKQLGKLYRKLAKKYGLPFINLAEYVSPSKKDGYHLDADSHKIVSELVHQAIINI